MSGTTSLDAFNASIDRLLADIVLLQILCVIGAILCAALTGIGLWQTWKAGQQ